MAITWRQDEVVVVGFCGLPVSAAAAMVAPFFESPAGRYFAGDPDSPVPPRTFLNRIELEEQRQAGYLTLTRGQWTRLPSGVVLYAHPKFVNSDRNPDAAYYCLPQTELTELTWDATAGVHLAYVARTRALAILYRWGDLLVQDSNRILSGRSAKIEIKRAMDSAQRALFCAPRSEPDHKRLRVEAFTALAVSYCIGGRPVERLYREMKLDFDELTISAIRSRAEAKAAGARAYPLTAYGTGADPADGKRLRVTVFRAAS